MCLIWLSSLVTEECLQLSINIVSHTRKLLIRISLFKITVFKNFYKRGELVILQRIFFFQTLRCFNICSRVAMCTAVDKTNNWGFCQWSLLKDCYTLDSSPNMTAQHRDTQQFMNTPTNPPPKLLVGCPVNLTYELLDGWRKMKYPKSMQVGLSKYFILAPSSNNALELQTAPLCTHLLSLSTSYRTIQTNDAITGWRNQLLVAPSSLMPLKCHKSSWWVSRITTNKQRSNLPYLHWSFRSLVLLWKS